MNSIGVAIDNSIMKIIGVAINANLTITIVIYSFTFAHDYQ